LSQHDGSTDLDCHPLIREYFGRQLQAQQPEAWRQAHETLYGYYKALPEKELPDTLEEMQPLFSAVAHGCAAGLHQQALDEVYYSRVQRDERTNYLCSKLGAFSDDLATISHFFIAPWSIVAAGLADYWKAELFNDAAFRLRALGRLSEAVEPLKQALNQVEITEDWRRASIAASNLSELQLTLGEVAAARESGQRSVDYADQSGDMFWRMGTRTTHADALHQAGEAEAALALFREAEQLQQERQPEYPRLYSLSGFRYCDLLLAQGGTAEVLERAEQTLEWGKQQGTLLQDIALDQLTIGHAYLQQGSYPQAARWLDQAVIDLRKGAWQQFVASGLLARAALHRHTRDFARTRQDLQEVFDIAEPSGMRLHLTDWHLEMARLLLEENPPCSPFCQKIVGNDFSRAERARRVKPMDGLNKGGDHSANTPETDRRVLPFEKGETEGISAQAGLSFAEHVNAAAKLIQETGYHRRDKELAELQAILAH
jgi:tetratricopeptide (TPR) repeat protein